MVAVLEDGLLVGLLTLLVVLSAAQIVLRNMLGISIAGTDQLLRLMVLWVCLLGAVAATREDKQITVDMLSRFLSPTARHVVRALLDLFAAGVSALVAYHGGRFVLTEYAAASVAFGTFPSWAAELILPLAFGLIALRYALFSLARLRRLIAGSDLA
jgi:TRAP-type C4-dicarboxylate transport system permease small subunit